MSGRGLAVQAGNGAAADAALERRRAVRQWLLMAADDLSRAQREWREESVALLRCGGLWGVVYIEGALVYAAAGTDDPAAVDQYLARTLRGPVFANLLRHSYYVLTPTSTGHHLAWTRPRDDAYYMGTGHYLAVPTPDRTDPSQRRYWCVEANRPGALVATDVVTALVQAGRDRLVSEPGEH
ncbi:hypothetical protein Shyhy01_74020 [Streptomyces hygroscopicus subsp. hygroscopicus]|uniref:hypothetical protein n=1 Tax=Streptomyces sp. KHY 26 TaxID=3097359 RepID=UPI0024A4D193|nr:hypothetical protein [Streptomyces hygroscopicus]GLX54453.1 hypothetical protein Shyhy01_74020 [Streptomyces hygroscopicus subsp. hygroscopicus]